MNQSCKGLSYKLYQKKATKTKANKNKYASNTDIKVVCNSILPIVSMPRYKYNLNCTFPWQECRNNKRVNPEKNRKGNHKYQHKPSS